MKKEKIICRCKEINEEEIREAVRNGACDVDAVKRMIGAGMGLCQGKTCSPLIARIISEEKKIPIQEVRLSTSRAPVRPVPIRILSVSSSPREGEGGVRGGYRDETD